MGGDEDRNPPGGGLIDQLPELAAGDGIDASGSSSKKTILGSWMIATEKDSFCFHPKAGNRPRYSAPFPAEDIQQLIRFLGQLPFRQAVDTAEETDILPYL